MNHAALVKVAAQSILRNKLRMALTMLGIVIGVAAVLVMIAVGQGAQGRISEQIRNLGTNLIVITAGSSSQGGVSQGAGTFNRLTEDDALKLKREATLLSGVSPVVFAPSQAITATGNWRTIVNGVSTDYQVIRDWQTQSGVFFSDADVRTARKVAVIGATVAKNLFAGVDPVGQQVQLRNVPFTIIGVMSAKGQTASGTDQDDVALIPYTTAKTRLSGRSGGWSRIGQILASTNSASDLPAAQEEIRAIMRESHRLGEDNYDDFTIRNQDELASAAQSTTKVMSWLLAAIASISLLVGGIGIMNIMLVSVTERTREIGIRLAVGARQTDVLMQFLIESIVLSSLGGIIGIVVGAAGSLILGRVTGWSTAIPPSAIVIAVGFSAVVGIFFGLYPAHKASVLDPIQALRYE